jgi:hypothetical protein
MGWQKAARSEHSTSDGSTETNGSPPVTAAEHGGQGSSARTQQRADASSPTARKATHLLAAAVDSTHLALIVYDRYVCVRMCVLCAAGHPSWLS